MLLLRKKGLFGVGKTLIGHVLGTYAKCFMYLFHLLLIEILLGLYYQTHFTHRETRLTSHSPSHSFNKTFLSAEYVFHPILCIQDQSVSSRSYIAVDIQSIVCILINM